MKDYRTNTEDINESNFIQSINKNNNGCINNEIMSKEDELEGIFEEKLYVNKRAPFKESNVLTKAKKNLGNWREEIEKNELKIKGIGSNIGNSAVNENFSGEKDGKAFITKKENPFGLFRENPLKIDYSKDKDLYFKKDEIGKFEDSDGDLEDVYQTKKYILEQQDKIEDVPVKNEAQEDDLSYKEKYKKLEIEFNKMVKTQKDVLRMKSKLYRFIYSEISAIEGKYSVEIDRLAKENVMLKKNLDVSKDLKALLEENRVLKESNLKLQEKLEVKNKEIQGYKEYLRKYQSALSDKVLKWKTAIELKIREYLMNFKDSRVQS